MGDTGRPATAEQQAQIEAEACSVDSVDSGRGFISRWTRVGLAGVAAAALAACSPTDAKAQDSTQPSVTPAVSTEAGTTPTRVVVEAAPAENPFLVVASNTAETTDNPFAVASTDTPQPSLLDLAEASEADAERSMQRAANSRQDLDAARVLQREAEERAVAAERRANDSGRLLEVLTDDKERPSTN